jgi:hypothetical protein
MGHMIVWAVAYVLTGLSYVTRERRRLSRGHQELFSSTEFHGLIVGALGELFLWVF